MEMRKESIIKEREETEDRLKRREEEGRERKRVSK